MVRGLRGCPVVTAKNHREGVPPFRSLPDRTLRVRAVAQKASTRGRQEKRSRSPAHSGHERTQEGLPYLGSDAQLLEMI